VIKNDKLLIAPRRPVPQAARAPQHASGTSEVWRTLRAGRRHAVAGAPRRWPKKARALRARPPPRRRARPRVRRGAAAAAAAGAAGGGDAADEDATDWSVGAEEEERLSHSECIWDLPITYDLQVRPLVVIDHWRPWRDRDRSVIGLVPIRYCTVPGP
jgi:hypothetical protein